MLFKRHFTKPLVHPYDTVKWIKRTASIPGANFLQENVDFPDFYSDNSVNIIASKYFCLHTDGQREDSLHALIDRVVWTNVLWGIQGGYFGEEMKQKFANIERWTQIDHIGIDENTQIYADELTYMLLHQMFSFNSPVWFNVGNPARNDQAQVSACFIDELEDNLESIGEHLSTWMQIFKSGSGVGVNRGNLRSKRESIKGGGKSSGPNSFAKIYDQVGAVTKSGGISRRAAVMEIQNIDHGDIRDFIWQKKKEEDKAKALIAAGYSSKFDDPDGAYGSVFFQNSNQSVRVTNAFMQAVEVDENWALIEIRSVETKYTSQLKFHTSQGDFYSLREYIGDYLKRGNFYYKVIEWVKARKLFLEIAQCAWETGDPGIQFHDIINEWHTCANDGKITASNPCSEFMFLSHTSCNLASHNLIKYYKDGEFDIKSFVHATQIGITAMDIWIEKAHYPSKKIAIETKKYRTLGIGYANLGALLMRMGLPYDSDKGRNVAGAITALLHAVSLNQSNLLAEELGAFERWEDNKTYMGKVIQAHVNAIDRLLERVDISTGFIVIAALSFLQLEDYSNMKFRNAQVTVMAPTGTIAFMMDCETTGVEPFMGLITYKTLVGGGMLKLASPSVPVALSKLGYGEYALPVFSDNGLDEEALYKMLDLNHKDIFATSLSLDNPILWQAHVDMMAAIQPFLSGAISKTINFPSSATVKDIQDAYMYAWKSNLKSIAIYRDGCKGSQPVSTTDKTKDIPLKKETESKVILEEISMKTMPADKNAKVLSNGRSKPIRKKLDETRDSITHKFTVGGHKGYLTVGLYPDSSPGEVFVNISNEGSTLRGLMDSWAIMFSMLLQYGCPLEDVVRKLKNTKFEPAGFTGNAQMRYATSIVDYIGKWMENEFTEGEDAELDLEQNPLDISKVKIEPLTQLHRSISLDGPPCSNCGNLTVKAGSCYACQQCGTTTGCG